MLPFTNYFPTNYFPNNYIVILYFQNGILRPAVIPRPHQPKGYSGGPKQGAKKYLTPEDTKIDVRVKLPFFSVSISQKKVKVNELELINEEEELSIILSFLNIINQQKDSVYTEEERDDEESLILAISNLVNKDNYNEEDEAEAELIIKEFIKNS